jgi:Methyltransferase domain
MGAYRTLLSRILTTLSKLTDEEVRNSLLETTKTRRLIFPRKLKLFDGSVGLLPFVIAYYIARSYRPELVVETGVWTGRTSWFILQALDDNDKGELVSVDIGSKKQEGDSSDPQGLPTKEIGGLVPQRLRSRWHLMVGDAAEILPSFVKRPNKVDFFLHDSNHSYQFMTLEFRTIWPLIPKGGFLCSDNVDRNSAWVDFMSSVGHSGVTIQSCFGICRKQQDSHRVQAEDPLDSAPTF